MRVAIAGAHGQVARRLGRLLAGRGDTVLGLVRDPDHAADLEADGVTPVVLDLESSSVGAVADVDGPTSVRRVLTPLAVRRLHPEVGSGQPPPWTDCDTPADLARARAAAARLGPRRVPRRPQG